MRLFSWLPWRRRSETRPASKRQQKQEPPFPRAEQPPVSSTGDVWTPRPKRLPDKIELEKHLLTMKDDLVKAPIKILQAPMIERDIDQAPPDSTFIEMFPEGMFRRMTSVIELADGSPYILKTTHYHSKNWGPHEAFLFRAVQVADGPWQKAPETLFCCYMGAEDSALWYRGSDCMQNDPLNDLAKEVFGEILRQTGQEICP